VVSWYSVGVEELWELMEATSDYGRATRAEIGHSSLDWLDFAGPACALARDEPEVRHEQLADRSWWCDASLSSSVRHVMSM
jgi:hypothetical protein